MNQKTITKNEILFETIKRFAEIKKTPNNIKNYFDKIGDIILNKTILKIKTKWFRIAEIEFYFNDGDRHPDPFTHNDTMQYHPNHWYFHKKGGVYRGGTWKGMDITLGQSSPIKFSGGILVRSIRELIIAKKGSKEVIKEEGEYIHGPSKVVDKILEVFKRNSVKELVEEEFHEHMDIIQNSNMTLYPTVTLLEDHKSKYFSSNHPVDKSKGNNKRKIDGKKSENEKKDEPNTDEDSEEDEDEDKNKNENEDRNEKEELLFKNKKQKITNTKVKFKTNNTVEGIPSFNFDLKKETVYRVPRVGLAPHPDNEKADLQKEFYYLIRNYRYLIYPNLIKKGKVQLVVGLYRNQMKPDLIQEITKSKSMVIEKYISDYEKGKKLKLNQLNIKKVEDLCRLFGLISNQLKH